LTKPKEHDTISLTYRPNKGAFSEDSIMHNGVTTFVAKVKELLARDMEQTAATVARALVDMFGMEPWEIAHDVLCSREGLCMSEEAAARALQIGLGLDARKAIKITTELDKASEA